MRLQSTEARGHLSIHQCIRLITTSLSWLGMAFMSYFHGRKSKLCSVLLLPTQLYRAFHAPSKTLPSLDG